MLSDNSEAGFGFLRGGKKRRFFTEKWAMYRFAKLVHPQFTHRKLAPKAAHHITYEKATPRKKNIVSDEWLAKYRRASHLSR